MKRKILIISGVLLIITIGYSVYSLGCNKTSDDIKIKQVNLEESKNTEVYATQNVAIENKNMIWCGTTNLAWNELRDNMIKEDIKLGGEDGLARELNQKPFTKDNLSDKDYIAMVGYKKDDIVNRINKALKDKFKEEEGWKVQAELKNPEDILAYSFLKKNITFKNAFEVLEDGMEFKGQKVEGFGMDKFDASQRSKLIKQIEVLSYNNEDDFIIELKGDKSEDEIVLAKIPPKEKLKETLEYALTNRNKLESDVSILKLRVPKIAFRVEKDFKELEGRPILNKNFERYSIEKATQKTEFSLTEKGAILKSKSEMVATKSCAIQKNVNLIFDKPFLIYMKEKNSNKPYLVLWVNNSEIMMDKPQ